MNLQETGKHYLKVPKAAEIIAAKIKRRIVNRELREGEFLPPESKLMEEFGVSRPTIREAYRILESQNLVSVTRGARGGAVIHKPDISLITSHTLLALAWEKSTVDDVYQTRLTVEPAVVRRVAEVASHKVVEYLQPILDEAQERATAQKAAEHGQGEDSAQESRVEQHFSFSRSGFAGGYEILV